MERINLTKAELLKLEKEIKFKKHVDRYFLIRQFCHGTVVDSACGVGYGSYIIGTNPDVSYVIGVDICKESIEFANKEYSKENEVLFIASDIKKFTHPCDTLVSLETLEHLTNPKDLVDLAIRCDVRDIIISYPTKKSTNFNKFHTYDFIKGDIVKLFEGFRLWKSHEIDLELEILFFTRCSNPSLQGKKHYYE